MAQSQKAEPRLGAGCLMQAFLFASHGWVGEDPRKVPWPSPRDTEDVPGVFHGKKLGMGWRSWGQGGLSGNGSPWQSLAPPETLGSATEGMPAAWPGCLHGGLRWPGMGLRVLWAQPVGRGTRPAAGAPLSASQCLRPLQGCNVFKRQRAIEAPGPRGRGAQATEAILGSSDKIIQPEQPTQAHAPGMNRILSQETAPQTLGSHPSNSSTH